MWQLWEIFFACYILHKETIKYNGICIQSVIIPIKPLNAVFVYFLIIQSHVDGMMHAYLEKGIYGWTLNLGYEQSSWLRTYILISTCYKNDNNK